jgi:glycosyltransferase involved in cell wall biosynthesis
MVGRLISTKHQDRLVEIFLKIEDKNWILVLIGYDHLGQNNSDRLSKLINDNNAKDRVILAGKQSDVEKYYLSSKIFAFTSSSEGFPNVIGEALSAGLPVVSYDCDAGPSDLIIHGENGYLVPVFDDIAFRVYLEKLMNDDDLRKKFSQKGREDIKRFDRKIICEAFLSFVTK